MAGFLLCFHGDPATAAATTTDPPWRTQELLMSEVMRLVGQSLAPEVVLREMLPLLSELLGLNRGRIVLADGVDVTGGAAPGAPHRASAPGPASIRYACGLTRAEMARGRYKAGEGITGAVLATGQPIIVQDIDAEPRFLARAVTRDRQPQETVAFIALPIEINRRTVGVLGVHRIRRRHRLLNDDVALLKILATLAGQLLQLRSLVEEKTRALEARNALLTRALESAAARYGIIGTSPALLQALGELERVSQASASVLLLGESGTGKELFARAVHLASPRRDAPFIKVNCAAIPDTLFESELFGHERGRLHRRQHRARRLVRAGRPRHDLPRRDRRAAAAAADQAAAHAAGGHDRAPGRQARAAGQRAAGRGDEPRPGRGGRARRLPARPVLPAQRDPDPPALAERTARGHPAARAALPEPHQPGEPAQHAPCPPRSMRWRRTPGPATSANWRT